MPTRAQGAFEAVRQTTQPIAEDMRLPGDAAPADYTLTFDAAQLNSADPPVPETELKAAGSEAAGSEAAGSEAAEGPAPTTPREAIGRAAENIRAHHSAHLPPKSRMREHTPKAISDERVPPTASADMCAPRDNGPSPTVTTMLTVPAAPARAPRVAVRTPPGPDAPVDAATLPAARLCGADTTHTIGGARPSPGPARAD